MRFSLLDMQPSGRIRTSIGVEGEFLDTAFLCGNKLNGATMRFHGAFGSATLQTSEKINVHLPINHEHHSTSPCDWEHSQFPENTHGKILRFQIDMETRNLKT